MVRITQADVAHVLGLHVMAVSRAVTRFGRHLQPLSEDTVFHLLVAGALRDRGLSFSKATGLVVRFCDEIRYIAGDPDERRLWIIFIDDPGRLLTIAAVSGTHLSNILDRHPMARTLALHPAVAEAVESLAALKARKEAA